MAGGRKPYEPTKEDRIKVSTMAACGMPQWIICARLRNPETGKPLDQKTLRKVFRKELNEGKPMADALVKQALFQKAIGSGPQSVTAAIFYLKTQCGWNERGEGDDEETDPKSVKVQTVDARRRNDDDQRSPADA